MSRNERQTRLTDREPDALDHAIERTLREIVSLEMPERLSARVMAHIADGASVGRDRPAPRFLSWPVAAGLAAAAAVILAIGIAVTRDPSAPAPPAIAETPRPDTPSGAGPEPPAPTAIAQAEPRPEPPAAVRRPRAAPARTDAMSVPSSLESIAIDALAAPEPILIEDIAPDDVSIERLRDIPRMEIAPIDVNAPRDDGVRR